MIGDILMGILGTAFLVGSYMQFRCRGPVWSTEYVAASPKEKHRMQTKQEYYWSAVSCLYIGILFWLTLILKWTSVKGFLYAIFVLSAFLFLHILYGIYRAVRKSTTHKK